MGLKLSCALFPSFSSCRQSGWGEKSLSGTFLALFPSFLACRQIGWHAKKLVWYLLYIHLQFEPNPMVHEKLVWHKSYIQFRVEPNSMVHEKLVWHKSYIHIRFRLNPVGSRQEMSIKGPIHKGTCLYRMERPTSIPQGSSITATFHKECFRKVVK